jgi:hypothetical protein
MFPSTALFYGVSLLSNGSHRSGSPPSPILRRRYAILHCMPVTYDFASGFRAFLPCFVPRLRAPVRPEAVFPGQGHFHAGFPHSGFPTRTIQDFSGSLAIHPMPLPCSATPAESSHPRPSVCLNAAPAPNTAKAPAVTSFRGQNKHGFNICCLRFTNRVASAHARLASGWLARLCREGVEPSGLLQKVSGYSTFLPPSQDLS